MTLIDPPKFNPYHRLHIAAWEEFSATGNWPINEIDVWERTHSNLWVVIIQSKMAAAWVHAMTRSPSDPVQIDGDWNN